MRYEATWTVKRGAVVAAVRGVVVAPSRSACSPGRCGTAADTGGVVVTSGGAGFAGLGGGGGAVSGAVSSR